MFKKSLITTLVILLTSTTCVFNVFAEDVVDEHIYLLPNQTIYMTVDGDVSLDGYDTSVATIGQTVLSGGDQIAQLGTNDKYDGDIIGLYDAVYKFTLKEGHKYTIQSIKNNKYLKAHSRDVNEYHSTDEEVIQLRRLAGTNEFAFVGDGNRCLFFEYLESGNKRLDHWYLDGNPNPTQKSIVFHIYKYELDEGNKPKYTELNDFPADGDKCIIVAEVANGVDQINNTYKYVIYPGDGLAYSQTAKWHYNQTHDLEVELKITAGSIAKASNFKVTKDSATKTYRVHVADVPNKIENADVFIFGSDNDKVINKVTIIAGSQYQLNVKEPSKVLYWLSENENVATVNNNGLITAIGTDNGQVWQRIHIGYVDKTFIKHSIEVVVINQGVEGFTKNVNTYLQIADNRTTVGYAWILNKDYETVREEWPSSEIKAAMDAEINVGEVNKEDKYSLVFFGKTTDDRRFEEGNIKVDDSNVTIKTIDTLLSEYETKTNPEEKNIYKLLTTAKENGWQTAIIIDAPESNADLNKSIYFNSSYIIKVIKKDNVDYDKKEDKHELKDETPATIDSSFKEGFNLSVADVTKTIFKEYNIYHVGTSAKVENAELAEMIDLDIDVSDLLDYDHSKIAQRKFKVLSIHNGSLIDWGTYSTYSKDSEFIRVPVNKFSRFAVVAVDTLVTPKSEEPNQSSVNTTYIAPNTSVR